jgi:hypothetical protein
VLPVQFGGEPQVLRDVSDGVPGPALRQRDQSQPVDRPDPDRRVVSSGSRDLAGLAVLDYLVVSPCAHGTRHEGMRRMVTPLFRAAHTELADR